MPEHLAFVAALAGFGLIIAAGVRLGAGSSFSLVGLVATRGVNDWPRGVQEPDVPPFAVAHADALRGDAMPGARARAGVPAEAFETAEIVELYERRLTDLR